VLDHAFAQAKAVVVLFTPDDEAFLHRDLRGKTEPDYETELTAQARPNVLFEAGMALGVHPDRTVLVELGTMRPFSDIYGRHVVRLDHTDKPLRDIARRLKAIGCTVDDSNDDWTSTNFPERA
jgi:predicted nucleotide-binding protein